MRFQLGEDTCATFFGASRDLSPTSLPSQRRMPLWWYAGVPVAYAVGYTAPRWAATLFACGARVKTYAAGKASGQRVAFRDTTE